MISASAGKIVCYGTPKPTETLDGPIKAIYLAGPADAARFLHDYRPYEECSAFWKRKIAGKVPQDSELDQVFTANLKSWFPYGKTICNAVKEINAQFQKKGIKLDKLADRINLALTTGAENGGAGDYTLKDTIVLTISSNAEYRFSAVWAAHFFSRAVHQSILDRITREFFHIWCRSHRKQQTELYKYLGYYPCKLSLPSELSCRLFPHPQASLFARHEVSPGKWAVQLTLIDETKDDQVTVWIEVTEDEQGDWVPVRNQQGKILSVSCKEQCIHPQRRLADMFMNWVWHDTAPEDHKKLGPWLDSQKAEAIFFSIFNP